MDEEFAGPPVGMENKCYGYRRMEKPCGIPTEMKMYFTIILLLLLAFCCTFNSRKESFGNFFLIMISVTTKKSDITFDIPELPAIRVH